MKSMPFEDELQILINHAWDRELTLADVSKWVENFSGDCIATDEEKKYAVYLLTRFMFVSKRLIREMLRSLYRDVFEAPLKQRIRRQLGGTRDAKIVQAAFARELEATRFIGVGNPSESGAHLLYYFRQVNRLPKSLFLDCAAAFRPVSPDAGVVRFAPRSLQATRYVFFDDLVGSGNQACLYLTPYLKGLRRVSPNIDFRFLSLFSTSHGLDRLNESSMFNGKAECLFELDDSYKSFGSQPRYFSSAPSWMNRAVMKNIAAHYGSLLDKKIPLGYDDSQLLLAFSHNTPDNSLPIFWNEGRAHPWAPIFLRYDKVYS